ncbi:hypothetical protein Q7P37_011428 [Cladosporium fusiforme]
MAPPPPSATTTADAATTPGYSALVGRAYHKLSIGKMVEHGQLRRWPLSFDGEAVEGELADFILDVEAIRLLKRQRRRQAIAQRKRADLGSEEDEQRPLWETEEEKGDAYRQSIRRGNRPRSTDLKRLPDWVQAGLEQQGGEPRPSVENSEQEDLNGRLITAETGLTTENDAMDVDVPEEHNEGDMQSGSIEERDFRDNDQTPSAGMPAESDNPKIAITSPSSDSELDSLPPYRSPSPTTRRTAFRPFLSRAQKEALKQAKSAQTPMPAMGKRNSQNEDAEIANAPPPAASTRSHTRRATQHAALKPQTKDVRDDGKTPRVDEATEVTTGSEEPTVSTKATAGNATKAPQTTTSPQQEMLTNFVTNDLWFRYCKLGPIMNSPSDATFATTKVDGRGVRTPSHPAPEAWAQEVQQRLELLLQNARVDKREAILKNLGNENVVSNLLSDEYKWVVYHGPLKGRRNELGVLLEVLGIVVKGDIWKV